MMDVTMNTTNKYENLLMKGLALGQVWTIEGPLDEVLLTTIHPSKLLRQSYVQLCTTS